MNQQEQRVKTIKKNPTQNKTNKQTNKQVSQTNKNTFDYGIKS